MAKKAASHWAVVTGLLLTGGVAADPPPPVPNSPPTTAAAKPAAGADVSSDMGKVLDRPVVTPAAPAEFVALPEGVGFRYPIDPPLGFTGRTSVEPSESQGGSDFVPMEDRWRLGMPAWDRYGMNHPLGIDYPYDLGNVLNPYKQNVLKGDYPIIGQNTFLNLNASSLQITDGRQTPIGTTPFESTARPGTIDFYGSPNQLNNNQYLRVQFDLFHGDGSFKPIDWRVVVTPVFNINTFNVDELGVVSPDIRKGTQRDRSYFALEEYFVETKIADTSPYYDFVSVRAGSQFFNTDFRGFLFTDTNKGVRLFGTEEANRDQFNVVYFRQSEKETNSGLNTFDDRGQDILLANFYRQDFPGYTLEGSVVYDHDSPSFRYDSNNFLVRPDPVGTFKEHEVNACYLGLGGDGHIGRYNITNQFYYVFGHDSNNPLAGQGQTINAFMGAVELSYDRDWARFRVSAFYASGDHNTSNHEATGFDTILDNPNFAGGEFSFWQHNAIKLFGVNLKQEESLVPDLRSSKIQGQANFINPGLTLINLGVDFDLTPKLKMVNNCNFLWFNSTAPLELLAYNGTVDNHIGTDLSTGFEYRPLLSNNVVFLVGVSTLIPGGGLKTLYDPKDGSLNPLVAGFVELTVLY